MKNLIKYLVFPLLFIPPSAFANDPGLVRLSLIEGDVQALVQDTTDWTPAAINLPLNEHDRLWVADAGRAELQIQGGVYVRAQGNSSLDLLTVNRDSAQFYLDQGHIYINNRQAGISTVQIDTPLTSIRSFDNSILMVDVNADGVNEISVLKGMVYAESRAGETSVTAGNTLTIRSENDAELSPIGAPDEWERWNVDRDREVSSWSESSRYLPAELHEYASDFDENGRWDYVPDYGYAWFPTVVAADWAPYSYGNWVWIRGSYVWIDYDPWGWAPSHYGRWVFVSGGWCWVPPSAGAVYWGPGYVGWVVTPAYVAWVPLAPGETYYGYGYYGPGSVNIASVNINTVIVNRSYRNARAAHSVIVVRRDTFGTGRRVPVRTGENPFTSRERHRERIAVVPPRTRPERTVVIAPPEERRSSRAPTGRDRVRGTAPEQQRTGPAANRPGERDRRPAPAVRAVPPVSGQRQLPPERVRRTRPEEVKNERPLIRQREASAFQSQPPRSLPVTRSNEPRVINRRPVLSGRQQSQQRPQAQQSRQPRRGSEERRR